VAGGDALDGERRARLETLRVEPRREPRRIAQHPAQILRHAAV